jgi:hypothetical protein
MFALPTPKWDQREPISMALCCAGSVLRWAALAALTLTVLTFAMLETAQACSDQKHHAPRPVAQSPAEFGARQPTVITSIAKATIGNTGCLEAPDRCHEPASISSCCSACTSALMVAGWTPAQGVNLNADWPPPETRLPAVGSGTQFRPPRVIL